MTAVPSSMKCCLWVLGISIFMIVAFTLGHLRVGRLPICASPNQIYPIPFIAHQASDQDPSKYKFQPSKFINVRAVFVDDRPRDGHSNATVFLANVWKNITDNKLITGCQVGNVRAGDYKVKVIGETPLWRAYPQYNVINHEEVLIDCYNVPAVDGDVALLLYKTSSSDDEVKIAISERPVANPLPKVKPSSKEGKEFGFTVLTCTKVFGGNPPWLIEWLQYQKALGVDHVHLNADEFFFRDIPPDKRKLINKEIESGFLTVEYWIAWLLNGKETWYHNQGLILEDCTYRFRGTYDYMFVLDTDDFFVPRVPNESKVHYYIQKYFTSNIGSYRFRWVEFFPDVYLDNEGLSNLTDGNVTALLKDYSHYMQGNRKSLHRTQALVDTATHYAFKMVEGFKGAEAPVSEAYVAHIRKQRHPNFYKSNVVKSAP